MRATSRPAGIANRPNYWEDLDHYWRLARLGAILVMPDVLVDYRYSRVSARTRDADRLSRMRSTGCIAPRACKLWAKILIRRLLRVPIPRSTCGCSSPGLAAVWSGERSNVFPAMLQRAAWRFVTVPPLRRAPAGNRALPLARGRAYPMAMYFGLAQLSEAALHGVTDYKLLLERSLAFSSDAVHVLVGSILQLVVAALLRTSVAHWRPLLIVAAAQFANELLDFHYDLWPQHAMQLGESIKDCLLTLTLPGIVMLTARRAPAIFKRLPDERSH